MIAPLLNHLWQSSLCVGLAGLIALALRRNSATVRFWVWFAASFKFLVPFAALTALGAYALAPVVPPVAMPTVTLAEPLAKPFSAPQIVQITARLSAPSAPVVPALAVVLTRPVASARVAPPAPENTGRPVLPAFHFDLESTLLALWAAGFVMLVMRWLMRWLRLRALLRDAVAAEIDAPITVKFSASRLEPGLVGILSPVILLPQGIDRQLSPAELAAVLAHELGHWRRRDNLLAAIHMLVEALFWFFPLVWWVGARLNAEREHACDEGVLAAGNDPQIYAEGILKICRVYLQSPLACVAGVSGANLGKRIRAIMENGLVLRLNAARKFVLSATAAISVALPIALGLLAAPVVQMQAKAAQMLAPIARRIAEQAPSAASIANPFTSHAAIDPVVPLVPQAAAPVAKTTAPDPGGDALSRQEAETPVAPLPDQSEQASAQTTTVASLDPPPASDALSAAVAAQATTTPAAGVQATMAQAPALRTCELPKMAAIAPLQSVPGSDLLTVPVLINGSPQRFLLDLALGRPTKLSPELVAKLSLPAPTAGGVPGVQPSSGDFAIVRSFGIDGVTTEHVVAQVANYGEIAKSAAYDGLLSGSVFQQDDVEINFPGKKIAWLTPTNCSDPHQVVFWAHKDVTIIPMTVAPDGHPQVQATIRGHVINAEIDVSAARTIMRRDIAEHYVGLKADTPDMMPVEGLEDGRHMQVYVSAFLQIAFADGGITAENVPVLIQNFSAIPSMDREQHLRGMLLPPATRDRIPDLTIGMDVLSQLHMLVARGQGKIYVTGAPPPSNIGSAAALTAENQPRAVKAMQVADTKSVAIDEMRFQQAIEARIYCTEKGQGSESRSYRACVNTYLQSHYNWQVSESADGSLHASAAFPSQMRSDKGNDTPGAWMNNARTVTQPNLQK